MRDLIFLMDDPEERFCTPSKMGNSLLNRFAIDEAANFEVLGIHNMAKLGRETINEVQPKTTRTRESDLIQKGPEMLHYQKRIF